MRLLSRRILGFSWRAAGLGATLLFFLGLVVRLSVKDHFAGVCAVYYAMPPLVLAIFSAFAAVYWHGRKNNRMSGVLFAAAFLCIVWCYQSCYVANAGQGEASGIGASAVNMCLARGPSAGNEAEAAGNGNAEQPGGGDGQRVRLLFWNVCRGQFGWKGIVSTIRRHDADVIALVESGRTGTANWWTWRKCFPEYAMTIGSEQLIILCRGRISGAKLHRLNADSRFETADIETRGESFGLVLVDLGSAPLDSRTGRIARLAETAKSFDRQPLVMVGDFNLPIDSVHFELFAGCLQNAFREAGNGYAPTWPMPLPLIQIDHVWTNRHISVDSCTTEWTRYSDHRPLVLDFQCKDSSLGCCEAASGINGK